MASPCPICHPTITATSPGTPIHQAGPPGTSYTRQLIGRVGRAHYCARPPSETGRARFHASGSSKPFGVGRLVVVRRVAASFGPFTAEAVSNLSSGSDSSSTLSWGSPDPRQHPFGSGHQARYPASYPGRLAEGASHRVPVSCCLSAAGIGLSGHPVPARELGLPHGRLTGHQQVPGPGRGYHVPRLRDTTGAGALSTPGTAVLPPAGCRARPSPAASQRPVPAPRTHIPPAGLRITGHQRGFTRFTRPACPSPVASRMGRQALGLSPVLRTPPLPAAHDRAGPGVSTHPELRDRHSRPSNPRVHSHSATSCRNGRSGRSLGQMKMALPCTESAISTPQSPARRPCVARCAGGLA